MMVTSEGSRAVTDSNQKLLESRENRGIKSQNSLTVLSKALKPEKKRQFKLIEDPQPNRFNDLLIRKTILVTLFEILSIFRDTDRKFGLKGDLLEMITNEIYIVHLANLSDREKLFAMDTFFDQKA